MKIIKLYVLSLLFVGSFNVLGAECKVKNKDLTYEITSSVYSNNTKIGTCKCKAGYEFKINPPLPMGVLLVAGKDNLFTEPSGLAKEGKELQCVISKDDTKLSTNDWVIPISILSAVAITVPINYLIFKRLESSSNTPTNTIEMLDRHLLPENQLQSVERNIYSKLDTSRVAPSNENTPADFGRNTNDNFNISENTNDNFNISEHTFVDSNVIEDTDVNSNLIENTGASNETIYTSIDGDSVHTPLNGGATGGPGDLPSTTADAGIRTAPPVPERGYREISSNVRGKCNIL
jgi:hypothetical protein